MRVVIAEDDALLREGLTLLLAGEGFEVVAAVDNGTDFLAAVDTHAPEATVVDVRLPPDFRDEGLRAAIEARRRRPGLPVLVLSAYVEDRYAAELLADGRGAIGYLLKQRVGDVEEFADALRRVAAGGTVMDAEVVGQLLVRRRSDDPLRELTPREREVLALMAEGRSNTDLARLLVISEGAVNKHIRNIFAKLGLAPDEAGHRRVLAVLAYLNG
ncbi:response regulator [Embleya hyalina]|uniref:DNA-binding response regulator n=1 Tax=Embleya hyalina TaxID=516124 RepID=A0A401YS93_9ACTN|nr:response regulator transcription factor [Embleya hyalina]GCD97477.1 DNA-binding response regulator [Embleya hyalina]